MPELITNLCDDLTERLKHLPSKDDELFGKYNLEAIVSFMKEKFANLGTTYQLSNLSQIRVLLCSIFPSGLTWEYPGLSNTPISPIYQSIRGFGPLSIGSGAGRGSRTHMKNYPQRFLRPSCLPFHHPGISQ